jgi:4'-phosphopantetheinyl transferase
VIEIFYTNVAAMGENEVAAELARLPSVVRQSVLRYKSLKDRRLVLGGKLLLQKYYAAQTGGGAFPWDEYRIAANGKPYLAGGAFFFNISHSRHISAAAFSDSEIGFDIEYKRKLDPGALSEKFHPAERAYVLNASDPAAALAAFYRIWTRKEALLKAMGDGFAKGLETYNCVPDTVSDTTVSGTAGKRVWRVETVDFPENYAAAVVIDSDAGTA